MPFISYFNLYLTAKLTWLKSFCEVCSKKIRLCTQLIVLFRPFIFLLVFLHWLLIWLQSGLVWTAGRLPLSLFLEEWGSLFWEILSQILFRYIFEEKLYENEVRGSLFWDILSRCLNKSLGLHFIRFWKGLCDIPSWNVWDWDPDSTIYFF